MRTVSIGELLPRGELRLKWKSKMSFDISYWEDDAATIPSDLTGSVTALEITLADGSPGPTFTAANSTNRAVWTLTSAQTTVSWERATFILTFTKSGDRDVLAAGPVLIQRVA